MALTFTNVLVNLPKDGSLAFRIWQDGCAVYHVYSGETHWLQGAGAIVFERVSQHAVTKQALHQHLLAGGMLTELRELDTLLAEYQALSLIEISPMKNT